MTELTIREKLTNYMNDVYSAWEGLEPEAFEYRRVAKTGNVVGNWITVDNFGGWDNWVDFLEDLLTRSIPPTHFYEFRPVFVIKGSVRYKGSL